MPSKIKISKNLFACIISFLESLDAQDLSDDNIQLYGYVLYALKSKNCHLIDSEPF